MEFIGQKDECHVCQNRRRRICGHHLSYEPEIIVYLCSVCHFLLHELNRGSLNRVDLFKDWIEKFGGNWTNGTEQYFKSEYRKKLSKENDEKRRKLNPRDGADRQKRYRERNREHHLELRRKNYQKNKHLDVTAATS